MQGEALAQLESHLNEIRNPLNELMSASIELEQGVPHIFGSSESELQPYSELRLRQSHKGQVVDCLDSSMIVLRNEGLLEIYGAGSSMTIGSVSVPVLLEEADKQPVVKKHVTISMHAEILTFFEMYMGLYNPVKLWVVDIASNGVRTYKLDDRYQCVKCLAWDDCGPLAIRNTISFLKSHITQAHRNLVLVDKKLKAFKTLDQRMKDLARLNMLKSGPLLIKK